MRDLDLTTLRLYVAVCEAQSMARASEEQHVVASTISKRLAQLEQTIGVKLLERRRNGVMPTAAGEIILAHARTMLATSEAVERDMNDFGKGIRGQIRLLASMSAIAESLPDDIASFLSLPEHSRIRIATEESVSSNLAHAVRDGAASLGICWDAADLEGLAARPYRTDHLAVIVPKTHPLARKNKCTFEETLAYEQIGLPTQTAVQTMLRRRAALLGKPLSYRVIVSTFDAAMRCVGAGLGIAIIPGEITAPFSKVMGIRTIPLTEEWAKRRFAICYRNELLLSPAAKLLVGHLCRVSGNA